MQESLWNSFLGGKPLIPLVKKQQIAHYYRSISIADCSTFILSQSRSTMIPGTGRITSALLLLTITAELFGQKLPDRVMRLPLCFHSIQVPFYWPRSTNKRAPRSWHQLFPSSHNSLKIVHSHCRAKAYKSFCFALFLHVLTLNLGRIKDFRLGMEDGALQRHMSGNNAKYV